MTESGRFQNKKLNKNDHKNIKKAAKRTKTALNIFTVMAVATPVIKKYGKTGLNLAKNIILKR